MSMLRTVKIYRKGSGASLFRDRAFIRRARPDGQTANGARESDLVITTKQMKRKGRDFIKLAGIHLAP